MTAGTAEWCDWTKWAVSGQGHDMARDAARRANMILNGYAE
jgi:hypothetical protein